MKAHKFDTEWFKRQFGPRPDRRPTCEVRQSIDDLKYRLSLEEEKLRLLNEYAIREDAALKCFVATIYNMQQKRKRS